MKVNRFFPLIGIVILLCFCQCKSLQVRRIEKLVNETTETVFFNRSYFEKSRKLMFDILPSEVSKSDTVIILEYYTSFPSGNYSCTIYDSQSKNVKSYKAASRIVKGELKIDSMRQLNFKDYILPMVLDNQLEEIKKKGKSSSLTPGSTLIINILTRDKITNRFDIQRLETLDFPSTY